MLTDKDATAVRKNHHRHLDRISTDAQVGSIPPAKNSLGCRLNHHTTATCTSPSNVNIWHLRMFFNRTMWTWYDDKPRLYAECSNTSYHMAFSWSCTLQATRRWALSCSRVNLICTSYSPIILLYTSVYQHVYHTKLKNVPSTQPTQYCKSHSVLHTSYTKLLRN
jgi:hypothetical protein